MSLNFIQAGLRAINFKIFTTNCLKNMSWSAGKLQDHWSYFFLCRGDLTGVPTRPKFYQPKSPNPRCLILCASKSRLKTLCHPVDSPLTITTRSWAPKREKWAMLWNLNHVAQNYRCCNLTSHPFSLVFQKLEFMAALDLITPIMLKGNHRSCLYSHHSSV